MEVRGREYGWKETDAKTAQARADRRVSDHRESGKISSAEEDENGVLSPIGRPDIS